jgi:hypothetical protein
MAPGVPPPAAEAQRERTAPNSDAPIARRYSAI